MLILCTDSILVEAVGDRMRLRVPSGSGTVEIDLSLHNTLRLSEAARRAAFDAMDEGFASPWGKVIRFARPRKARRA